MAKTIEASNLKKSFKVKGKNGAVHAVRGVSLSVNRGEIFGFLGPNGAGKTTSMRMLTTLLPIDEGQATIVGFDVKKQPREVRKHIGYVSQLGGADLSATGRENILLAGRLYGVKRGEVERNADALIRLLDLYDLTGRMVKTYSGGQKRRLEIALGLIHKPDVLFLDEPTTGLDPQNRANIWEHIRKLRDSGMTVFLTTHYMEEADELADRLAIMDYGKIVAEGTPKELKQQISGDAIVVKPKHNGKSLQTILRYLETQEFTVKAKIDGEAVLLYVKDGTKAMPLLFDFLKANDIELDTVSLSQPSLNDVFLKQTGRLLRDTGREAIA